MANRKTEGAHAPGCKCAACVRARSLESGAMRAEARAAAMLRSARKPAWVDIHGVGMRRI